MRLRTTCVGMALALMSCTPAATREPASELSIRAVLALREEPRLGAETDTGVPFLRERHSLARGVVVDEIGAHSTRFAVPSTYFVIYGTGGPPTVVATDWNGFGALVQEWWPSNGAALLRLCVLAARAGGATGTSLLRGTPVERLGDVPPEAVGANESIAWTMPAPLWHGITPEYAGVEFWLVHNGGATRLSCTVTRRSASGNALSLRVTATEADVGYNTVGG
jgi:hypothetical protein